MNHNTYIVATIRPWNIQAYHAIISHFPGNWQLVTEPGELTADLIRRLKPRFIFFPHWSHIVPDEILNGAECVCFHSTDLPYGRGGSPIQNLIVRGHTETMISALRMVKELDAGPIYLKKQLSLEGTAQEIFERAALINTEMMREIIETEPVPVEQQGEVTVFKRRTPKQSEISIDDVSVEKLYDHIRMLDAEEYPRAFLQHGAFRIEFREPRMNGGEIEAKVHITKLEDNHG